MKSAAKAFGEGMVNLGTNYSEQRASHRVFQHAIFRYALSVVSVAVALAITLLLEGYTFRTPFFFPAIILSTWIGGIGPGIFAVFLSTLAINYFILEPKLAFSFGPHDLLHLSAFLVSALLVSSWSAARKRAEQALQRIRNELETKVEERTGRLSKLNDDLLSEIAERVLTEDQLRQTEQRLRDLIANAPVILFALDSSGVVTLSEGKGLETFGVKSGELVGQSVFDLYHDSPGLHSDVQRALAGEAVTFITEANDQFFEIHLIPTLDKSGKVAGVNGVTYNITDRRRTERELRLVIDTIPAMAWSTLPSGANDYCSKSWLEYTGMALGTELDHGWLDAFHPEDRAAHLAKWRAATETGELFESVARIRGGDGEYRWFLTQGVPLRDESGKIVRWYGTNVDIDERKRAQSLLEGEKNLLEMIATGVALKEILNALCLTIESCRNGTLASVLLLNRDGVHLDSVAGPHLPEGWTKQMEKLPIGPCAGSCGTAAYRASRVIVSDIATDPLWDVTEHRASALRHGLRASWSSPILSSKGKVLGTFCLYYRAPRSPDSHDLGLIETATHLARVAIERDRAEVALRNSEEKYRDLITASPDAICVTDVDGKIVLVNPAGVELFGPPEEELIGTLMTETYVPEELHLAEGRIAKLKTGGSLRYERKLVRRNGEVIPVEVSVSSLRGQYFQAIIRDISQRKRAEEALRASEQVARGQVEALTYSLDVLATAPAPDKFLGQMLSTIGRLLDAQSVVFWLLDEANGSLVFRAAAQGSDFTTGDPKHPYIKDPLAWKENKALEETILTGAPFICEDLETDPRFPDKLREYLLSKGIKKGLNIPTLVGGRVKGFIGIRHAARPPYRPEEIELAQALAHQAMLAIQMTDLAEQGRRAAILGERNRMARDIHDTLAQGFTGVIVQLEAVADAVSSGDHKEAENYLRRASDLARQSLNEARRSVHALRPEALLRANFWDALKDIIKNTTAGSPICTKTRLRGKLPELPHEYQENLMHIGQEALTNTLKYAHADNFETQLICSAEELRLEFQDDGDGFNVREAHDGFGLAGMRERVEEMGGRLKIMSARGKGTKVAVVLPLNGESMS
jgi:PAS domain S-box-containing protein